MSLPSGAFTGAGYNKLKKKWVGADENRSVIKFRNYWVEDPQYCLKSLQNASILKKNREPDIS